MEPSNKQQQRSSQKTKRRDRAARMLRQKQQLSRASSRGGGGGGGVRGGEDLSENEGDESPLRREKRPPPPTRKKRNKEPVFQEDIIDGFAFLCFKTYEDLEKTVNKFTGKSTTVGETASTETGIAPPNEPTPLIDDTLPQLEKQKTTPNKTNKKANNANLHRVKKKNILNNKVVHGGIPKEACLSSKSGDEIIARSGDQGEDKERQHHTHKQHRQNQQAQPPRTASRDQLSDASSHASLERGYMCDSESGNERGSEPECDLFTSKCDSTYISKKNNPGHSNSCRSPPVLPPIHPVVVQNGGHHHPEPSTAAVAAVTASASPANTVSAMVVGSASPREPQIGSPAVLPIACPSPASPPAGVVPPSQPPFLQKGPSPATVPPANVSNNKEVENASGSKLISNGYEAVSDTSPPPSPLAKLLSPSKFLHKRPGGPPVSSCRLEQSAAAIAVAPSNKPAAINVYDFVSDHSAPSSPDGVVFLSQLKSHHHHHHHHTQHHGSTHHLHKGASSVQQPLPSSVPLANKPIAHDKISVSNGHSGMTTGVCPSSPMGPSPAVMQNSHKSALDMSMKSVNGPPSSVKSMLTAAGAPPVSSNDHRHHHQLPQQHHQHPPQQQQQQQQKQQQQQQQQQPPPPPQHHQPSHQLHHPPQQQQSSRSSSYNIPYSTSQPPVVRKMSSSPRMSPLPISMSLSSPVLQSSSSSSSATTAPPLSSGAPSVAPAPPVNTRTFVTTTSTTLSSSVSSSSQPTSSLGNVMGPMGLRCSPVVTTSHPNTPTPVPPRDTHSSHSNSSLSSLSQLSSTPMCHKDGPSREGGSRSSHSNSGHHTPSASLGPPASAASSSASAYTATSSLASLVFSKPHTWGSSSGPVHTTAASHVSPLPSRSTPTQNSSLPLPPSLPPAHHTSPFGSHPGPPPPPLLPVASHHGIFGPGSITPTLPLDATTGPSPYRAETLFPQPNPDLLRRELDTRFLASQDHSIPIPPPPYMQTEVHQHGPIHQQPPFIGPPSLGAPLVTQPTPHLYEKYPKLDSALYGRPSIGLSGYPPVSALFAPGGGASTPFAPPAHLTALQPKINSVPKTKSLKPGKWCAMHVRIAWEIYNHQQKQKRAEAHKAGMALAAAKPPTDPLHATNHLFSLPRQHDLSFSSSLLSAAASAHPRTFETSSHHSTFLNPTPAHLGPFSRPGYPGFGAPGPGFSGLGPLGLPGSAVLGADLRGGCLTQDPWGQRTALSFPGNPPWGGLKEEAERDRIQQEQRKREEERKRAEQERREKEERERREHERREQERREMERREQERKEQERKERERKEQERREMERREMERREQQERREQERQKERDRELRLHHQLQKNSTIVMNGEMREHHLHPHLPHHAHLAREWERVRESRDHPRSPIQLAPAKYETGLERQPPPQQQPQQQFYGNPRLDVKVKQERKDDEPLPPIVRSHRTSSIPDDRSSRKRPSSMEPEDLVAHASRGGVGPHGSLPPTLGLGPHGLVQSPAKDPLSHSQASPLWGPLTPSPTVSSLSGAAVDHYRTRDMLQGRGPEPDRRFDPLVSVMSQRERCTSSELSRQLSNAIDLERQFLDREHAAAAAHAAAAYDRVKLLPPPLRTNESPYMTPPTLPPASASSFFSPPVSPYLNSLCPTAPGRSKVQGPPPSVINGLPPPLIPCTFPMQNPGFPATNRTASPMAHKLAQVSTSSVLNLHHDSYFPKERREVNGHPSDLESHLRL